LAFFTVINPLSARLYGQVVLRTDNLSKQRNMSNTVILFKYVTATEISWIKRNLNKMNMVTGRWPDSATQ